MTSADLAPARPTRLRLIGLWLATPMALLQAVNAVRAFADPVSFSAYMGAPLVAAGDGAWVLIYALRTGFIALLLAALIARRDIAALKWVALAALIMPAGDAWLAHSAGAESAIVVRHLAILAFVVVVGAVFWLADRKPAR